MIGFGASVGAVSVPALFVPGASAGIIFVVGGVAMVGLAIGCLVNYFGGVFADPPDGA